MSDTKPTFSSLGLPKADEESIDAYAKSRGVPTLDRKPKPRSPSVTIRTDVPDYLAQAMRIEAAKTRSTLRYLILKALKNDGWKIDEGDIVEDGRRPGVHR
ncbi:hypothetical protein A7A08_02994 [Methyloligella halotolerans]|uniref:Uncharacterized protein n=1 Tax=Methyloligella halotolerans TaxID=1177755 RepID=A0A1E2RV97_9HYPH|nr:hypothetical protein [Methyloligella halotolerans]ODA66141.1 hypothetical protein A7A08_02994 [Methyloligella halotolerans]